MVVNFAKQLPGSGRMGMYYLTDHPRARQEKTNEP